MAHVEDRWFTTIKGPDGSMRRESTERNGRGLRWRTVWKDADGRRRSQACDRRRDAQQYAELKETDAAWVRRLRQEYAEEIRLYIGSAISRDQRGS